MTRRDLENEVVRRIRSHHEIASYGCSDRAKMKQRVRADALSDLLGWIRSQP